MSCCCTRRNSVRGIFTRPTTSTNTGDDGGNPTTGDNNDNSSTTGGIPTFGSSPNGEPPFGGSSCPPPEPCVEPEPVELVEFFTGRIHHFPRYDGGTQAVCSYPIDPTLRFKSEGEMWAAFQARAFVGQGMYDVAEGGQKIMFKDMQFVPKNINGTTYKVYEYKRLLRPSGQWATSTHSSYELEEIIACTRPIGLGTPCPPGPLHNYARNDRLWEVYYDSKKPVSTTLSISVGGCFVCLVLVRTEPLTEDEKTMYNDRGFDSKALYSAYRHNCRGDGLDNGVNPSNDYSINEKIYEMALGNLPNYIDIPLDG